MNNTLTRQGQSKIMVEGGEVKTTEQPAFKFKGYCTKCEEWWWGKETEPKFCGYCGNELVDEPNARIGEDDAR